MVLFISWEIKLVTEESVEVENESTVFFKHPTPNLSDIELFVNASEKPLAKGVLTERVKFPL
jgi:hypothetical protein